MHETCTTMVCKHTAVMFTLFYLSNITGCDYHVTDTYDPDVAEIKETAQAQF